MVELIKMKTPRLVAYPPICKWKLKFPLSVLSALSMISCNTGQTQADFMYILNTAVPVMETVQAGSLPDIFTGKLNSTFDKN